MSPPSLAIYQRAAEIQPDDFHLTPQNLRVPDERQIWRLRTLAEPGHSVEITDSRELEPASIAEFGALFRTGAETHCKLTDRIANETTSLIVVTPRTKTSDLLATLRPVSCEGQVEDRALPSIEVEEEIQGVVPKGGEVAGGETRAVLFVAGDQGLR